MSGTPRLYTEFASWWPLLSDPSEYVEEAAFDASGHGGAMGERDR